MPGDLGHLAVFGDHHGHEPRSRAAGPVVVLPDKTDPLGLRQVGVESDDRYALPGDLVQLPADPSVVHRGYRQPLYARCQQFIQIGDLLRRVHRLHRAEEHFHTLILQRLRGCPRTFGDNFHGWCFHRLQDDADPGLLAAAGERPPYLIRLVALFLCDLPDTCGDLRADAPAVV